MMYVLGNRAQSYTDRTEHGDDVHVDTWHAFRFVECASQSQRGVSTRLNCTLSERLTRQPKKYPQVELLLEIASMW